MKRNKHKRPELVVELPEDFKQMLLSKLKQQDEETY